MSNEPDYTEIRDPRIRAKICELLSEMLDNPDEHGIFPTSRFMWEMESFILEEKALPQIDFGSWFYKNCQSQRRRNARICESCPFKEHVEAAEAKR